MVGCIRNKERIQERTTISPSNLNKVTGNKTFWITIKPFLFDKGTNINKSCLVDKDKVISVDKQLCKTLSNFLQRQ